ncbi:MAG TPA: hypothetical protein VIH75_07820 [Candidatus Sulfotelmatobacter sp.]
MGGIQAKALKPAQPCRGNIRISKSPAQRAIVFPPAPETTGNARISYIALKGPKFAQKPHPRATGRIHLEKSIAPCISLAGIEQELMSDSIECIKFINFSHLEVNTPLVPGCATQEW